ncbi:hypothetical protein [Actinoplanes auranticolor]|uniref:Uncharacterized protein n=1 Tax=Actinoplanes auranticolor TaxID=47988 RepID=A0A919SRD3_9ACTN|nr:hypothetical protein [Actinoplanes auranticolor]GIM76940.1 hypothetical protein Aau02nite_73420 [Actinoplanes auranticolor]
MVGSGCPTAASATAAAPVRALWDALAAEAAGVPATATSRSWDALTVGSFPASTGRRGSTLTPSGVPVEMSVSVRADGRTAVRLTTDAYATEPPGPQRLVRQADQLTRVSTALRWSAGHRLACRLRASAPALTTVHRFGLWCSIGYRAGGSSPAVAKVYLPPQLGAVPAADLMPEHTVPMLRRLLDGDRDLPARTGIVGLAVSGDGPDTVKVYRRVERPCTATAALALLPEAARHPDVAAVLRGAAPVPERQAVVGRTGTADLAALVTTALYLPTKLLDPATDGAAAVGDLTRVLGLPSAPVNAAVRLVAAGAVPTMLGIRLTGIPTLTYYLTATKGVS